MSHEVPAPPVQHAVSHEPRGLAGILDKEGAFAPHRVARLNDPVATEWEAHAWAKPHRAAHRDGQAVTSKEAIEPDLVFQSSLLGVLDHP